MQSELTQDEKRALRHLLRRQETWRRVRWAMLALGLSTLATGVFLDRKLSLPEVDEPVDLATLRYDLQSVAAVSSGRTLAYLLSLSGFFGSLAVLGNWRGDPSTLVLLALARRLGDLDASDTTSTFRSSPG